MLAVAGWHTVFEPETFSSEFLPDQALSLWQEWRSAHEATTMFCRKQQRLETELLEKVGFPRVLVPIQGQPGPAPIFSAIELEKVFEAGKVPRSLRDKVEADLASQQAQWDAADATVGFSAAKRDEERSATRENELAELLLATPAQSLAGVCAKMRVILANGQWCDDCPEFPWPQLRVVLDDLARIGGVDEAAIG
jgi:hypothetical protein